MVYISDQDGNYEIYVMNANGTDQQRLTDSDSDDLYPKWSNGSAKIVFSSARDDNSEIYEMEVDGNNQTRITHNDAHDDYPFWTTGLIPFSITTNPAADVRSTSATVSETLNTMGGASNVSVSFDLGITTQYLYQTPAYTLTAPGTVRLNISGLNPEMTYHFRAKALGTETNQTVYGADSTFTTLSPAKEGKIVFSTERDGNDELYVMNADGYNQTRLTNNPATERLPALSPDGSKIAFQSDRDGSIFQIYTMNIDGSDLVRLTSGTANVGSPSWSPDGSMITFSSESDDTLEIFVMQADGSEQTRLTDNTDNDFCSSWSPDGSKIIFTSSRDGNDQIYIMNVDGTDQTRLTESSNYEEFPVFSPDGSKIAYVSNPGTMGVTEIWVMNADGTDPVQLTSTSRVNVHPVWSPDGSKIAFNSTRALPDDLQDIWVMDADGSNPVLITGNSQSNRDPSWSAGNWISPTVVGAGYGNLTTGSAQAYGVLFSFGSASSAALSFQWGSSPGNYTAETLPQILPIAASDPSLRTILLAVMNPSFQTIADLPASAAMIACNPMAYANYVMEALQTYGKTNVIPVELSASDPQVLGALQTGVIDALVVGDHPSSVLAEYISSGQVRLLSWSSESIAAVVQAHQSEITSSSLPAGTYPGQTQAIPGFGLIGVPCVASLTGLAPDTTYYVRTKAVGNGTSFSTESSFKTLEVSNNPPGGNNNGGGGGGGGGGGAPPAPVFLTVTLNGFTSNSDLKVNSSGMVQSAIQLKLDDSRSTLDIADNTRLSDGSGNRLESLTAKKLNPVPNPPYQSAVIMAYEFGPEGARFDPALSLTLKYDPQLLPAGVDGSKITLVYWNGTNWVAVDSKLDVNAGKVTAKIEHFSRYALVVDVGPAKFEISDLKIKEVRLAPNGAATVQTVVSNSGYSSGTCSLVLKLNGSEVDRNTVTLGAGENQTVDFALNKLAAGTYIVEINGKTVRLLIESSEGMVAEATPLPVAVATAAPVAVPAAVSPSPLALVMPTPLPEKPSTFPVMWLIIGLVIGLAVIVEVVVLLRTRRRS